MNAKKIAEKLRRLAKYEIPSQPFTSRELKGIITDIADELDPPAKPLLADAKVGDLCKRRDGKWVQVDSYSNDRPCPVMCKSDIGGQDCFTLDGRNHNAINDSKDIIHTEPLAEVGSAEWAWQMAMLGEKLYHEHFGAFSKAINAPYNIVHHSGSISIQTKSLNDFKTWLLGSNKFATGWQLYEEPKPAPAFKVGDWVEIDGKQYRLSGVPLCGCAYPHNQKWYVLDINGNEFTHYTSENIRKLDPSEVRVKVTLEGTVSPGLNNPEEGFYLSLSKDSYAYVRYEMLDPDTAALVRALLKAQEEK